MAEMYAHRATSAIEDNEAMETFKSRLSKQKLQGPNCKPKEEYSPPNEDISFREE